jgi:hypothetical protein
LASCFATRADRLLISPSPPLSVLPICLRLLLLIAVVRLLLLLLSRSLLLSQAEEKKPKISAFSGKGAKLGKK